MFETAVGVMLPALPVMNTDSLMEGGVPEPPASEVAFTRILEITTEYESPGARAGTCTAEKLTVEPLTMP